MQNDGFCRKEAGHYPCVGQKNTHVWSNRPFSPLLGTKQKDFDAHRAKCSAKGRTRLSHCGPWPGQVLCQNAPNLDKSPLIALGLRVTRGYPQVLKGHFSSSRPTFSVPLHKPTVWAQPELRPPVSDHGASGSPALASRSPGLRRCSLGSAFNFISVSRASATRAEPSRVEPSRLEPSRGLG